MRRGRSLWVLGLVAVICVVAGPIGYLNRRGRSGDSLALGISAYGRGDWRESIEQARRRLEANPSDPKALRLCARAWARLGRAPKAEAIYLRLDTGFLEPEDLFLLGSGFLRQGAVGPALAVLSKARATNPDHP